MGKFDDFDAPVKTAKATAEEVRARCPEASKIIDEFKAAFGDIRVDMIEENGFRIETAAYKRHLECNAITADRFIQMGVSSRRTTEFVNRTRNGK